MTQVQGQTLQSSSSKKLMARRLQNQSDSGKLGMRQLSVHFSVSCISKFHGESLEILTAKIEVIRSFQLSIRARLQGSVSEVTQVT